MNAQKLRQQPVAFICGSPGHDQYFRNNFKAKQRIFELAEYAGARGIGAFLRREYPTPATKNFIINEIDGRLFCVDGNCHLVSLLIAYPGLTIEDLLHDSPAVVRFWRKGVEDGRNDGKPYDVYIPYRIFTEKIPDVRCGIDGSKPAGEKTKIIRADIPFDSSLFLTQERGYPLYQTAISVLKKTMAG